MHKNPIIRLENLSKRFGSLYAVKSLNLKIYKGDILGLLGPNGSGKTTSIYMMSGLIKPSSGKIFFDDLCRKNMGIVFENHAFYDYLTGIEYLSLLTNLKSCIDKKVITTALSMLKLQDAANKKIGTYSLGMRQRLALTEALILKPKFLILDEPTNGLDLDGKRFIISFIKEVSRTCNMTILIASHSLYEIETLCNRICILNESELKFDKYINDIKNNAAFNLRVDNPFECIKFMETHGLAKDVSHDINQTVSFFLDQTSASALNSRLVNAGFKVSALYEKPHSLRDLYFNIISKKHE